MLALPFTGSKMDFDNGMIIGYATMLLAFSMIVVAVKNYRDKYNNGAISFGKAFQIGMWISLIGSTIYVGAWLIYFFTSDTNFMADYSAYYLDQMKASGASQAVIDAQMAEMKEFARMYRNPFFNALMTYMEILPVGLLVSLIIALIMKRKQRISPDMSDMLDKQ
jgi:NADH:ubiquinone oxidoreductase subunit 6 (subunit J)